MASWVRYPLPLFWAFPPLRTCEVEVRYPPPSKGVSQRYLRDTLCKQGKWVRYPPLRYYLERVLRDMGGISHWAAKYVTHWIVCHRIAQVSVSKQQSLGVVCPPSRGQEVLAFLSCLTKTDWVDKKNLKMDYKLAYNLTKIDINLVKIDESIQKEEGKFKKYWLKMALKICDFARKVGQNNTQRSWSSTAYHFLTWGAPSFSWDMHLPVLEDSESSSSRMPRGPTITLRGPKLQS